LLQSAFSPLKSLPFIFPEFYIIFCNLPVSGPLNALLCSNHRVM